MSNEATTSQTATKPFEGFRDLAEGLFGVSKKELDAKLAEEKATRQAERERKALERRRQERQKAQK